MSTITRRIARAALEVGLGLAYSNASEWVVHKYILHDRGKKGGFWAFHWHDHHKKSRQHQMVDPDYRKPIVDPQMIRAEGPGAWLKDLSGQGREALSLLGAGAIATLLLGRRYPFFLATGIYGGINYYRVHKKSHLDPAWAREHLPWHVDHHMGPDQDANWCVTKPWADIVMGTRKPYVGTEREAQDLARKAERKERERSRRKAAEAAAALCITPDLAGPPPRAA